LARLDSDRAPLAVGQVEVNPPIAFRHARKHRVFGAVEPRVGFEHVDRLRQGGGKGGTVELFEVTTRQPQAKRPAAQPPMLPR